MGQKLSRKKLVVKEDAAIPLIERRSRGLPSDEENAMSEISSSTQNLDTTTTSGTSKQQLEITTRGATSLKSSLSGNKPEPRMKQIVYSVVIENRLSQQDRIRPEPVPIVNKINTLNSRLLDAIIDHDNKEVKRLLNEGASPNATCQAMNFTACHVAAYINSDALSLLIEHNAIKDRKNNDGATPLHFAAWAGNNRNISMLLNFNADVQKNENLKTINKETKMSSIPQISSSIVDVACCNKDVPEVEESWKDSQDLNCKKFMSSVKRFKAGWTPLHVASFAGCNNSTWLLLAAGANPNIVDELGDTPLAVVGDALNLDSYTFSKDSYLKTIEALLEYRRKKYNPLESSSRELGLAVHTAVRLCSKEAVQLLLKAGAPITHYNHRGNTPLHECVVTSNKMFLQILAQHRDPEQPIPSVDVTDKKNGYTVLQSAVLASWTPGVRIALNAGADITHKAKDGYTAVHFAALKGNLEILNQILDTDTPELVDSVNYGNDVVETPVICAIRSGNLECVKALLNKGATLKYKSKPKHTPCDDKLAEISCFLNEHETGIRSAHELWDNVICKKNVNNNNILHASWIQTTEVEFERILEHLFICEKSFNDLLDYRCPETKYMIPVEVAAFEKKIHIYKFLLVKTVEHAKSTKTKFDPIILWLNFGTMFASIEQGNEPIKANFFYEMLATTIDIFPDVVQILPRQKVFILHDAIKCNNREMILLLIQNGADLSVRNNDNQTAISLLMRLGNSVEFIENMFDDRVKYPSNFNDTFASIVHFDYRVLAPTMDGIENEGQMKVLKALVETGDYRGQKELLVHPLVESFLYRKWLTYSKYYGLLIMMYILFAISLTILIVSVYYYNDRKKPMPSTWMTACLYCFTLGLLSVVVSQELTFLNISTKICLKNWPSREMLIEYFIKCNSFVLAIVTPLTVTMSCEKIEWWRYLAVATLVLVWSNIMVLLSKTPTAGYYMQMFWSVSYKIIKILLTFSSLLIMFALSFMILFHTQAPFDNPLAAFTKTLVMLTSEFEYENHFSKVESDNSATSVLILQCVFILFLIFTAIVLMNLMTGVAVSDASELIYKGNLRRLEKQIEFLYALEVSRKSKSVFQILSLHRCFKCEEVTLQPHIFNYENCFNDHIATSITKKAQEKFKKEATSRESNELKSILKQILKATIKNEENIKKNETRLEKHSKTNEVVKQMLDGIIRAVAENL